MSQQLQHIFAFGPFRFDPRERLLFREDQPVPLTPKVADTLLVLLHNAGHLVDKEELMRQVWPDAAVEEGNLNKNIFVLRKALARFDGDREYIETVPKRGYRFVAPLEIPSPQAVAVVAGPHPPIPSPRSRPRYTFVVGLFCAFFALVAAVVVFWFKFAVTIEDLYTKRPPQPVAVQPDFRLRQLTTTSSENHVLGGAISPDGKYLAYTDTNGLYLKRLDTNESLKLASPGQNIDLNGQSLESENDNPLWLPDSGKFLVNLAAKAKKFSDLNLADSSIWEVTVPGGQMRKIRDHAFAWSISFDGSLVAFASNQGRLGPREAWLMDRNGENAHKLDEVDDEHSIGPFLWSADGRRLTYVFSDKSGDSMMSRDLLGHPPIPLLSNSELTKLPGMLTLPDGREIFSVKEPGFSDTCNFWSARLDAATLRPAEKLKRITNWTGFCMDPTSSTGDAKSIAFKKWTTRNSVYIADLDSSSRILKSRHFVLDESGNTPAAWTPDGASLLFFSNRNGQEGLFAQLVDRETPQLLASAPGIFFNGQISPDGASVLWQIAAEQSDRPAPSRLVRAPIGGGVMQTIAELPPDVSFSCARAPAALCVLAERSADRRQLVVSAFDLTAGRRSEILRFDINPSNGWSGALSPDGTQFALIDGPASPLRVYSLRGSFHLSLPTPTLHTKQGLRWASDARSFFITSGAKGGNQLHHVDWHGRATLLWENNTGVWPVALPSPDGRRLAIQSSSLEENIWLMENF